MTEKGKRKGKFKWGQNRNITVMVGGHRGVAE